jgi:hypothetical protein
MKLKSSELPHILYYVHVPKLNLVIGCGGSTNETLATDAIRKAGLESKTHVMKRPKLKRLVDYYNFMELWNAKKMRMVIPKTR